MPKKAQEDFSVYNRWDGTLQFTAKIECAPDEFPSIKLGLAVKWAFKNGASLVGAHLVGASLVGAHLVGAHLDGASLVGAHLVGASLVGAHLDGAHLDGARLVGAHLDGASLVGAHLDGASLVGAHLDGARLDGALVFDKKVKRLVAIVSRIQDPYVFHAFETEADGVWIRAGCRWFSLEQYRAHTATYSDEIKQAETRDILDFIECRAVALGAVRVTEAVG